MGDTSGEADLFTLRRLWPDEAKGTVDGQPPPPLAVYLVREKHYRNSWNLPNVYVVKGLGADLVVDSGTGLWNLRDYLGRRGLILQGGRPCTVAATHIHFDHAGGLHHFAEANAAAESGATVTIAIHRLEADALRRGDSYEAVCFMGQGENGKPADPNWRARDFRLRPVDPTRELEDGDVVDLGQSGDKSDTSQRFQVLHLPGHSRGSVGLWNAALGLFFSGDVAYLGPKLDWLPFSDHDDNNRSIARILEDVVPRAARVFPGHRDDFGGPELEEVCSRYLKQVGRCYECCTGSLAKPVMALLLKARNKPNDIRPKCCYYACCSCCCF